MTQVSLQDAQKAMKEIDRLGLESLKLPLPRRFMLDPVRTLRQFMLGPIETFYEKAFSKNVSSVVVTTEILAKPEFAAQITKIVGGSSAAVAPLSISYRHAVRKAPIMTVSTGLVSLLKDTTINENIPCRFFSAPFQDVYIEFDEGEHRDKSEFLLYDSGSTTICEGCYIQETRVDSFPQLRPSTADAMGVDRFKPMRIIDLGFTGSPIGAGSDSRNVAMDTTSYIAIYIQDEDEPFIDVLNRHYDYYQENIQGIDPNDKASIDLYESTFRKNLSFLVGVLFYLQVEREEKRVIDEQSVLEKRIAAVAEKKRDKLRRQLNRTYDRIVIGPKSYVPIDSRVIDSDLPKGTKAPHYRRGTIGIRWVGTGAAKEAKLVRIKESIVNAHLLKDETRKDYIIK